ncbi:MAG: hypothetical protein Q9166_005072 [cf. Caloplaca sp. 2 TL-2023]
MDRGSFIRKIFNDACNENPQINFNVCFNTFLQAYAYCGCYFTEPDQIYNCANVELQINAGSGKQFGPAPSSTILSSALLNGPIAPPSATLSDIPQSVPSDVPVFSPRQSSSLIAASTAFITSTLVVTSCDDDVLDCPATTFLSTSAVVSSTWACESDGCIVPPSSLPPAPEPTSEWVCPIGSCDIPSLPPTPVAETSPYLVASTGIPISDVTATTTPATTSASTGVPSNSDTIHTPASAVTASPTGTPGSDVASNSIAGGQQSTSTILSTIPVTRTTTITSCPATVMPCPSGYSSESIYTTNTMNTIFSCDGGCEGSGPTKLGECVVRKRTRILTKREL